MSTADRLAAYQEAELRILQRGQSVGAEDLRKQEAELAEIRRGISQLQSQLTVEANAAAGRSSLRATPVYLGSGE